MRGAVLSVLLGLLLFSLPEGARPTRAGEPDKTCRRRVYVLHSGVHSVFSHPDKNRATQSLREQLLRHGVPARDVVALDNPFPTASWANAFPRSSLVMFLESMDPASDVAHKAYLRLHRALQEHGVKRHDEIVWVGHSAGGQMGMTLAHLAHNLHKYPNLARAAAPYRFDTVVTLGTPVGSNHVPPEVKLRHYHSPADSVVSLLAQSGTALSESLGYPVCFGPCVDLKQNGKVRVFDGIRHPAWNRLDRIVERILQEDEPACRPAWHATHAECPPGVGLAQLLGRALDEQCRVCLEELPTR